MGTGKHHAHRHPKAAPWLEVRGHRNESKTVQGRPEARARPEER